MFTGLVEAKGTLVERKQLPAGERFVFKHPFGQLEIGESVAHSGACLTVLEPTEDSYAVDLSPETLDCTVLGELQPGDSVNLERAMPANHRLGGHIVTGHVDGVGHVVRLAPEGEMTRIEFEIGPEIGRYAAPKGSLTIDGVSLTINTVTRTTASVMLIPHTQDVTTLGRLKAGTRVNVEVDLVARYVERLLATRED